MSPNNAGQVGRFRPAQYVKSIAATLLGGTLLRLGRALNVIPPERTTEQGAAATAAPSVHQFTLLALRYERRFIIDDCRKMILDDPRARKSTLKFAREAVDGGLEIRVDDKSPYYKRALKIAKETEALFKPTKLKSFAWMQIIEGDLFVQAIIDQATNKISQVKRMPAASMERNVDDTDEFVDPAHAFSQVDTITNAEIATFPATVIYHGRWCHIDGEPYGNSEIVAARRLRRLLDVLEESQAIRRMTRAGQVVVWNVGTPEHPGTESDVQKFRAENGFVEGRREIFDPTEVARDFFGNGLVDVKSLAGDHTVSDVDDLLHYQNVYGSAGLPTPPPLYNLASESVNRDVLDDLRAEYLKDTESLSEIMTELVDWAYKLNLLLQGLLPEAIDYKVHFRQSTPEKPAEVIESTTKLHGAGLMSTKTAVQRVLPYTGVVNADREVQAIEEEISREQALQAQQQQGADPEGGGSDMPPTPTAAPNGFAKVG